MTDPYRSPAELADLVTARLSAGSEMVIPIGNGEPPLLMDALEASAEILPGVKIHQMHALRDRPYLHGAFAGRLEHVSWFLSPAARSAYEASGCDLIPANFSEIPQRLIERQPAFVIAAASLPDEHGWFSLGVSADYVAPLIGRVPFVLEANAQMPYTAGMNAIHMNDVAGWAQVDEPLIEVSFKPLSARDQQIGQLVAERIPDAATLQIGTGTTPRGVVYALGDHRNLGIHTELFSDDLMWLVESGVANGALKRTHRHRAVTTFAFGSAKLHEWLDHNRSVYFLGVDEVNDPRQVAREDAFVAINGAIQVDLFGQCASETIGTKYYTGSGGQADFARGAMFAAEGRGFTVLHSTTSDGRISRITPTLDTGAVVTTSKNTVDMVVTEYGVAELRGRSFTERARALIAIAAPEHREWLEREAMDMGLVKSGIGRTAAESQSLSA